jgi:hypothetical protein
MGDSFGSQPVGHLQDVPSHCPKATSLLVDATIFPQVTNTSLDAATMHVQAATAGVNGLHVDLLPGKDSTMADIAKPLRLFRVLILHQEATI